MVKKTLKEYQEGLKVINLKISKLEKEIEKINKEIQEHLRMIKVEKVSGEKTKFFQGKTPVKRHRTTTRIGVKGFATYSTKYYTTGGKEIYWTRKKVVNDLRSKSQKFKTELNDLKNRANKVEKKIEKLREKELNENILTQEEISGPTKIECPYCNTKIDSNLQQCPYCEKIFVETKISPQLKYTEFSYQQIEVLCPKCGKQLIIRSGKYGKFLGCTSYPECKFTFNPEFKNQEEIFCPKCGKVLRVKTGKYGTFVGCSGYPDCRFTFDLRK
ncbi:MAG: topoisomerase DNA-binding C4 zinc finger domain-containing protein [Candidatus Thorarchaeota archaeon]